MKIKKKPNGGKAPIKGTKEQYQAYQDSLDLYNSSQNVVDFYKNNPNYKFKGETLINKDQLVFPELEQAKKNLVERMSNNQYPKDVSKYPKNQDNDYIRNLKDYYQDIDKNKFKQRELNNFQLNLDAPFQIFDRRINPDRYFQFSGDSGDRAGIYSYSDKAAPKPVQPIIYEPEKPIQQFRKESGYHIEKDENGFDKIIWDTPKQRPKQQPINIQSVKPDLLPLPDINMFNPIPFEKGSYFTRPRQSQEIGDDLEYFDKKTGRKLEDGGYIERVSKTGRKFYYKNYKTK